MPRNDQIHEAVRNALVKDGWTITDDPFRIYYEDVDVYADLRVQKKQGDRQQALVIEIKSFLDDSAIHGLEVAFGQYVVYRTLLNQIAPGLRLYLAVANTIYQKQFGRRSFQLIVHENQVSLLVVDILQEEIVTWID